MSSEDYALVGQYIEMSRKLRLLATPISEMIGYHGSLTKFFREAHFGQYPQDDKKAALDRLSPETISMKLDEFYRHRDEWLQQYELVSNFVKNHPDIPEKASF